MSAPRPVALAALLLLALPLVGCGDRCEQLCVQTATRLARCKSDSTDWRDLGARNRTDFANQCREDWERTSNNLTATEVREALRVCRDTERALDDLTCPELIAIYQDLD